MKESDRHSRRKPFANWMKRLANLKNSSSNTGNGTSKGRNGSPYGKGKKAITKNNPYLASGKPYLDPPVDTNTNGHLSFNTSPSEPSMAYTSPNHSRTSMRASSDDHPPPTLDNKSVAPTISTNPDTVHSDAVHSKAGTSATVGGGVSSSGMGGGEGSTFSSPAPSIRSMTTTLTTMQSAAPSAFLAAPNQGQHAQGHQTSNPHTSTSTHFHHQFPTSPVSAIPPYLNHHVSTSNPQTYSAATANNLLSDNASVMTLASSSKRRRRNSLDTNASVRALAPSSMYGGSKESLPLSVLSASISEQPAASGHHQGRTVSVNLANAERASVYSSSGIVPALPSERNSYYATKQNTQGDGASVRSGLLGHSRNDSITRSLSGMATAESPMHSPREQHAHDKLSRRNSGRTETGHADDVQLSVEK